MRRHWTALILTAAFGLACQLAEDGAVVSATDSLADSSQLEAMAEPTPPQSALNGPLGAFGIPDGGSVAATTQITPVWLINGSATAVTVRASAGAGEVELETVGAGDSALVELETWADTVVLEAIAEANAVGRVAVPMDARTHRVAFPR